MRLTLSVEPAETVAQLPAWRKPEERVLAAVRGAWSGALLGALP